eukprot:2253475-Alexandrium_andersonii.AAC.1
MPLAKPKTVRSKAATCWGVRYRQCARRAAASRCTARQARHRGARTSSRGASGTPGPALRRRRRAHQAHWTSSPARADPRPRRTEGKDPRRPEARPRPARIAAGGPPGPRPTGAGRGPAARGSAGGAGGGGDGLLSAEKSAREE